MKRKQIINVLPHVVVLPCM